MDEVKSPRRFSLSLYNENGYFGTSKKNEHISQLEDGPLPFDVIVGESDILDLEAMSHKLNHVLGSETNWSGANSLNLGLNESITSFEKKSDMEADLNEQNETSLSLADIDDFIACEPLTKGTPFRRNSLLVTGNISRSNSLLLLNLFDLPETHIKNGQERPFRKNSLLVAGKISRRNSLLPSGLNDLSDITKMQRRNSFLLALEILGTDSEIPNDGKRGKPSRRNSLIFNNGIPKRDSFIMSIDSFDLRRFASKEKQASSSLASKTFEGGKRKSNSIIDFLDSRFSEISFSDMSNADIRRKKMKRRSTIVQNKKNSEWISKRIPDSIHPPVSIIQKIEDIECETTSVTAYRKIFSLGQAMKSSEKSQTTIHEWDKKMGLRRSHSKTMRNSMRSRKLLLQVCSREMFSS